MASWGRHGWPRKNEGWRVYRERDGSYLMVNPERNSWGYGSHEAVANVLARPEPPSLGGTAIGYNYTYVRGCKRVEWSELPDHWQRAFVSNMTAGGDPFDPNAVRGLWLVENFPGEKR